MIQGQFGLRPGQLLLRAGLIGLAAAVALGVIAWLERLIAPGAGGVWLALSTVLAGIVLELRRRTAASCAVGPRLRPLQVSCLAAMALGVQLIHGAATPAFAHALPLLTINWLPAACILGGVAGLGLLSVLGDCRDAELRGRV